MQYRINLNISVDLFYSFVVSPTAPLFENNRFNYFYSCPYPNSCSHFLDVNLSVRVCIYIALDALRKGLAHYCLHKHTQDMASNRTITVNTSPESGHRRRCSQSGERSVRLFTHHAPRLVPVQVS